LRELCPCALFRPDALELELLCLLILSDPLLHSLRELFHLDLVEVHVMHQDVGRKAVEDPFMAQRLASRESLCGVPHEDPLQ
jgi:hypothetical protein